MREDRTVVSGLKQPRRGRVAARLLLALSLVAPVVVLAALPAGSTVPPGVYLDRKWHAFEPGANRATGVLAVDGAGRTGYAFSQPPGTAASPLKVRGWNLDTFQPRTPLLTGPSTLPVTSSTPIAVDQVNHDVVVATSPANAGIPALTVLGVRDGAVRVLGTVPTRFAAGYLVVGLAVDGTHGRLFLLGTPDPGSKTHSILGPALGATQVDVVSLADLANGKLTSTLTAPAAVPNTCAQPIYSNSPAGLLPDADGKTVYFGCGGTSSASLANGSPANEIAGVAQFEVVTASAAATHAFRLFPIAGNFGQSDSFAAPGVGRIALVSVGSGRGNVKVFDTVHKHYVGNVAYDDTLYTMTVNPMTGRTYMTLTNGRILVSELGAVPTTQGVVLNTYDQLVGNGLRAITFDSKTGRLFVPTSDNVSAGTDPFLLVLHDTVPPYRLDPDPDPDQTTLDAAEVPGLVESNRIAVIGAIGARTRMVGGTQSLLLNLTHGDTHGVAHAGTRFSEFGVLRNVRLGQDSAQAEAVTMRIDPTTYGEVNQDPAVPALCVDQAGTPAKASTDDASVSCDLTKQLVTGSASSSVPRMLVQKGTASPLPAPVQVRSATADTRTERLPNGRTRTTLTAASYGIDLLGVARIGSIVATVQTDTGGRPGTAHTTYTRTMKDVTIGTTTLCQLTCNVDLVRERLNDVLAGRASIQFPTPTIVQGKHGATADVTVDKFQHIEDVKFNDEDEDNLVTPAAIVTAYTDGTAPSRLQTMLASVAVTQVYEIFRVAGDTGGDGGGGGGSSTGNPSLGTPGTPGTPGTTRTVGGITPNGTPPATGNAPTQGLLGGIINGLRVVFRSPGQIAGIACVWMLLALPAYLSARRRLLLELPRLRRVQEDV
jgi:hypothetical protein